MSILSPIGKITKPFGFDGGVLANLYDTFPGDIDTEEPLFVMIDGLAVPLFVEHFQRRGSRGALFRFADFDSAARAEQLTGLELFVRGLQEADEGDQGLYFEDLVGYRAAVAEPDGAKADGTITAFTDSGNNPLFRIEAGGRELLIPAAEEFIESIDTRTREIVLRVPPGLIDLND